MRFEGAPDTEETEWQELVVGHLGINEHAVVDVGEEADALGPTATGVLRRHGQVWPANAYLHGPVFNLARGGSLLTGVGGDELFSTRASRLVFVVRRRVRPRAQDVRALALAAMPRWIRTAVWRRRHYEPYRWFTPQGARVAGRALAREDVSWPQRWDASVRHWYRTRSYAATMEVLSHLAADADITVVNPLLDPMVMAEMARVGGPTGFRDRSSAMLLLFGDLLPQAVLDRPTKATFDLPVWGPHARAFADAWGGQGIDARHVDPAALRREWLSEQPHAASMAWLHRAWLHSSEGQPPPTTASS
jgi:asparagine synthase (glutamine-hydrolysing)